MKNVNEVTWAMNSVMAIIDDYNRKRFIETSVCPRGETEEALVIINHTLDPESVGIMIEICSIL